MLTKMLQFLGTLLNMVIDTIYKIFRSLLIVFLVTLAIAVSFAFLIVWLT